MADFGPEVEIPEECITLSMTMPGDADSWLFGFQAELCGENITISNSSGPSLEQRILDLERQLERANAR